MTHHRLVASLALLSAFCLTARVSSVRAQQSTKPAQPPKAAGAAAAPPASTNADIPKKIELYLRDLYAWGPEVRLVVGPLEESPITGLLETRVDLDLAGQKESAKFYVTRDAKYLLRGEITDLSRDQAAETVKMIQLADAPSTGDPKATVTVVEFADFQCPVCKQFHDSARAVLPNYPQVRLVFKDFPLENIHPWAKTASIAARCTYQQDPKAFWTFYDRIYDDQPVISPENAWAKMTDFAAQASLNLDTFKACMAGPEAAAAVDASFENGRKLEVSSTPTVFINGRRMIGADAAQLEQFIRYELEQQKAKAKSR